MLDLERIEYKNMIKSYTLTEIEHTLYLFPFAKIKVSEHQNKNVDDLDKIVPIERTTL